jgi:hypothetical protein
MTEQSSNAVSVETSVAEITEITEKTVTNTDTTPAEKRTYSGQVSPCALSGLNLTNDPCNALNWQAYVEAVSVMSTNERYQQREQLGDSDVDQLKRLILDIPLATELTQKQTSTRELKLAIEHYKPALQPLLTILVLHNEMLVELEADLQQTKSELEQKSRFLTATQEALRLAQQKIDAITNIEQQLNSEGALTNDH